MADLLLLGLQGSGQRFDGAVAVDAAGRIVRGVHDDGPRLGADGGGDSLRIGIEVRVRLHDARDAPVVVDVEPVFGEEGRQEMTSSPSSRMALRIVLIAPAAPTVMMT